MEVHTGGNSAPEVYQMTESFLSLIYFHEKFVYSLQRIISQVRLTQLFLFKQKQSLMAVGYNDLCLH